MSQAGVLTQPPDIWWELYVQVPDTLSDTVAAYLHEVGSASVVFHEQMLLVPGQEPCVVLHEAGRDWVVVQGAVQVQGDLGDQLVPLQHFLVTCARETAGLQLYCRLLPSLDYQTQWQQFFHPLSIGNRLFIRPPWDPSPVPAHMVGLTLNPGPAFGTGTHPSTHLCLQMLTDLAPSFQGARLLDVGCGSGILSLAALQLGWESAIGVDIDPQAIPVALQNATLNGMETRVHYLQGSWNAVPGPFPCITANIYLGPLVEMLQPLARALAPGGLLILSGLLETQEEAIRLAVTKARLVIHTRLVADGWLALAVQHAPAG
ncbi:MAG: 50S ribosomal protein L11 methyltransferase [Candidatus Tectimicrobiota bacterium]